MTTDRESVAYATSMNKMHLTEEETLLIQWIRKTRLSPAELMLTDRKSVV